jgi:hypothetical protein
MMQGRNATMRRLVAACLLAIAAVLPTLLSAHEIPNDVTIQTFVKAEGSALHVLVRVPVLAMRDIIFPQKDQDNIDLTRSESQMHDAATLWVGDDVKVFEEGQLLAPQQVLAVRATPAEDRSFDTYDTARALLQAPQQDVDVAVKTGYLDILFAYPIQSATSRFDIEPNWARLGVRTLTTVRLMLPDGSTRAFELDGNPGRVHLDPRWSQAAARFLALGFRTVLDGADHLLFLVALVIPFRRPRPLLAIVGAFTAAYSLTFLASAYGLGPDALWFAPLIEVLMAASILYVTIENVVGTTLQRRWLVAFIFGLVHGVGFAFPLRLTLQFAGAHLLASLVAFNLGLEAGLLLVLALLMPALYLLFRRTVPEQLGTIVLSGLIAHTGWHWTADRIAAFRQYDFTMPDLTPALVAELLRYAMVLVALAAILWAISVFTRGRHDAQATS